jgi:hypothetical protein
MSRKGTVALLTPQKALPRWPLKPWSELIEEIISAGHKRVDLGDFCMALNNAALIELHRGNMDEAHCLCRWQIEYLLKQKTANLFLRMKYLLQPVVNLFRLRLYQHPNQGMSDFDRLRKLFQASNPLTNENSLFETALCSLARYNHSDPKIRQWIDEIYVRENLCRLLRHQDYSSICHQVQKIPQDSDHDSLTLKMLMQEGQLISRLYTHHTTALNPLPNVQALPFIISIAHLAQASPQPLNADLTNTLELSADLLMQNAPLTRNSGDILLCLIQGLGNHVLTASGKARLQRAVHWADRLNDEVLKFRLLSLGATFPEFASQREPLQEASQYSVVRGSNHPIADLPSSQFMRHLD